MPSVDAIIQHVQDILEQILPSDFKLRCNVVVNGQAVQFLAISPKHGAIAVLIPDMHEYMSIINKRISAKGYLDKQGKILVERYWSNASVCFKQTCALPRNLHIAE